MSAGVNASLSYSDVCPVIFKSFTHRQIHIYILIPVIILCSPLRCPALQELVFMLSGKGHLLVALWRHVVIVSSFLPSLDTFHIFDSLKYLTLFCTQIDPPPAFLWTEWCVSLSICGEDFCLLFYFIVLLFFFFNWTNFEILWVFSERSYWEPGFTAISFTRVMA